METFAHFTAHPSDSRLTEILVALHHEPNVLVVFNHPMWDLYLIGKEKHEFLVNEFLHKNGNYLHALELNGLRHWEENRAVRRLAESGIWCWCLAATAMAFQRRCFAQGNELEVVFYCRNSGLTL